MRRPTHGNAFLASMLLVASASSVLAQSPSEPTDVHRALRQSAVERPEVRRDASIELKEGLDLNALENWLVTRQLEPLDARGTFPFADQTMTVFFGDLASYDGSLTEVLEAQVATYHQAFLDQAIADLKDRARVADPSSDEAREARRQGAALERARHLEITWRSLTVIGRQADLAGLLDDPSVGRVRLGATNRAPYFDAFWDQPQRAKLPLDAIGGPSGEPSSAARIGGRVPHSLDGAVETPPNTRAATLCGPPLAPSEANCPPDQYWLPSAPAWYAYFEELQSSPAYVRGIAHTQNRWTASQLIAYKVTQLPHCNPVVSGPDAPCRDGLFGSPQEDVIYVPKSTFEAEQSIPNPLCFFRTGIASVDRQQGCFAAYYAASSLPTAYLDTTLFDDSDSYSATIGSAAAPAIAAGATYLSYVYFDAFRQNLLTLLFQKVKVRGQVGTRVDALCVLGFANCVFGVDTTTIDDDRILPVI